MKWNTRGISMMTMIMKKMKGSQVPARELALDDPNHPRAVEPGPVRIHLLVNVKISI